VITTADHLFRTPTSRGVPHTLIDHPVEYKEGSRVFLLAARHKDGAESTRRVIRSSHDADTFHRRMDELISILRNGERIYTTAGMRSVKRATRDFKTAQVVAEDDPAPEVFYKNLESRWRGCLMAAEGKPKRWLFDADTDEDVKAIEDDFRKLGVVPVHKYKTKVGIHYITEPFNRSKLTHLVRGRLHTNAMMLWVYTGEPM
jgi:hypothetical protein